MKNDLVILYSARPYYTNQCMVSIRLFFNLITTYDSTDEKLIKEINLESEVSEYFVSTARPARG